MKTFNYMVIIEPDSEQLEARMNTAGEEGWDIAKLSTIYDPEKGPLYVVVMKLETTVDPEPV